MDNEDLIKQVAHKIEREKALINAANAMRQSSNPQVQQSLDAQIREGRKNIDYLEERMRELRMRRDQSSEGPRPPAHGTSRDPRAQQGRGGYDQGGYGDPGPGGYQDQMVGGSGVMPPRAPFSPTAPNSAMPKARPNYSKLDLIKADTPYLGPRFQLMLSQLTFKLSVEKQYKDGIEKLVRLYADDGDRKSRAQAEGRKIESNQKIQLLKQALKRYEDLHVDMESQADAPDDDSINTPNMRKPLTGHLYMRIHAVKDVNHALTGKLSRGPETFVDIKVEDAFKSRTKATRTDRWTDEIHNIEIEKANEMELTVYDKSGTYPTPIGMLWIRISDIVEEMRRKKMEAELSGSQWVTADRLDNGQQRSDSSYSAFSMNLPQDRSGKGPTGRDTPSSAGIAQQNDPSMIEAWFALEPVGSIKLSMSFTKQSNNRRPFDLGLNRKGAVRQRKEEVQEQYGHKFVVQQFYSIMRCALCGDFLKYSAGMQCEDCKYTCHKNCYNKVVTKCISKSNAETDPDEEKLNHRIPHRFEGFSNMSANWCCHCGYILPFGKKNCRKCTECSLTVHAQCAHLVPDFCGMSMLRANEILSQIRGIPKKPPPIDHNRGALSDGTLRGNKPTRLGQPPQQQSYDPPPDYEKPTSSQPPQPVSRISYGNEPSYDQQTTKPIPPGVLSAREAATKAFPPQSPTQTQRPSLPTRISSQDAAAAAATAALAGKRTTPQTSPTYNSASGGYGPGPRGPSSYAATPMDTHMENPVEAPNRQAKPQPSYNPQAYASFNNNNDYSPQTPVSHNAPYAQQPTRTQMQQAQQFPQPGQNLPQQVPPSQAIAKQQQQPPKDLAQQQGTQRRIGLEHFNFLAVLGKGNFGKVMLAETKATKKLYAIKVLKKEFIIENEEVESTKSEKRVFLVANKERHPFLLNLHACFQTETRVYFVMEYISGGDLMLHIQRGQFGLKRAQFYAAEVCLALKYFHENGVIYRDLKLDNILLTLDGHIKIADYGLCKENMWYGSSTSTFCGTPEFMAPEILLDKKYGRAVDWWAFGVLIYQMLLQQSPFRGEDEDEIYDAILADEPLYPIHMPRDSVSILQKLLTREPELRLGSGPTDAQEIMSHAFFRNINWDDVRDKKVPPPFLPQISNPTDTSNFDSEFTSVTPVLTPVQSVLTQAMQEEFRGFSYSADFI
ncbi:MAG: Serine/threonine kinase [Icmadophila ericetorum]|nr:Serine/threonine kinase [Icmadophila ericetorum]